MGLQVDRELLDEFLGETGEILAQLERLLGELARRPADSDLSSAVFRGFHTVKGGAGFFGLDALVEICRLVEGAFNRLYQEQRGVDAHLLGVVSQALQEVKEMVEVLHVGEQPKPAGAALLSRLKELNEADRILSKTSRV